MYFGMWIREKKGWGIVEENPHLLVRIPTKIPVSKSAPGNRTVL